MFIDFANRDPDLGITPFDVREFAWEDSGSGFMNWLNWDMTNLLDSKFTEAQEMTYYKLVPLFDFGLGIYFYILSNLLAPDFKTGLMKFVCSFNETSSCTYA